MASHLVLINANPQVYSEVRKFAKECGLDEVSVGVFKTHFYHLKKQEQFQHILNSISMFREKSPDTRIMLARVSEIHVMNNLKPLNYYDQQIDS